MAKGLKVRVLVVGDPARMKGDALASAEAYQRAGGEYYRFEGLPRQTDLIIDGVFGTGLEREVAGRWREALVAGMNRITPEAPLALDHIRDQIRARDMQLINGFSKDAQITAIRGARAYRGDKLIRTAKPHAILDPTNGPLIAVRLNILTRKSLGGLHTDIKGQVLTPEGQVLEGLFAAGEVCGFGGGGYHGYNALEGTFLGGCLFSGRMAGQNA